MKIEISYKNSVIGSLSTGESLTLHLDGEKLTDDIVIKATNDESQILGRTFTKTGDSPN